MLRSSYRAPSWDRGAARTRETQTIPHLGSNLATPLSNHVARLTPDRPYQASSTTHSDQTGGEACLSSLLVEASFDVLGAERFFRQGSIGFAKQSLGSAIAELTAAAVALGVR